MSLSLSCVLGRRVGALRKRRRLSLRSAAASIGVPHTVLWRIEKGEPVEGEALLRAQRWVESSTNC